MVGVRQGMFCLILRFGTEYLCSELSRYGGVVTRKRVREFGFFYRWCLVVSPHVLSGAGMWQGYLLHEFCCSIYAWYHTTFQCVCPHLVSIEYYHLMKYIRWSGVFMV